MCRRFPKGSAISTSPDSAALPDLSAECDLAATTLLSSLDGAEAMAARMEQLFEQLLAHFARMVGKTGAQALFGRAVRLASARLPGLTAVAEPAEMTIAAALRVAMARQDPTTIIAAFAALLAEFAGLLQRLIGEPLAHQMLGEIWPMVFRSEKESL